MNLRNFPTSKKLLATISAGIFTICTAQPLMAQSFCDLRMEGTNKFQQLQSAIDNAKDQNGDGIVQVCLAAKSVFENDSKSLTNPITIKRSNFHLIGEGSVQIINNRTDGQRMEQSAVIVQGGAKNISFSNVTFVTFGSFARGLILIENSTIDSIKGCNFGVFGPGFGLDAEYGNVKSISYSNFYLYNKLFNPTSEYGSVAIIGSYSGKIDKISNILAYTNSSRDVFLNTYQVGAISNVKINGKVGGSINLGESGKIGLISKFTCASADCGINLWGASSQYLDPTTIERIDGLYLTNTKQSALSLNGHYTRIGWINNSLIHTIGTKPAINSDGMIGTISNTSINSASSAISLNKSALIDVITDFNIATSSSTHFLIYSGLNTRINNLVKGTLKAAQGKWIAVPKTILSISGVTYLRNK